MSREKTTDEVREEFLSHIRYLIDYWNRIPQDSTKERLEGLVFSILVALDGGSSLPGFIVAPIPHETDRECHIENGKDYYPENYGIENQIKGNIAGGLHKLLRERGIWT